MAKARPGKNAKGTALQRTIRSVRASLKDLDAQVAADPYISGQVMMQRAYRQLRGGLEALFDAWTKKQRKGTAR